MLRPNFEGFPHDNDHIETYQARVEGIEGPSKALLFITFKHMASKFIDFS